MMGTTPSPCNKCQKVRLCDGPENGKKSKVGVAGSTSLSFVQLAKKRTTIDDVQVHSEESIRNHACGSHNCNLHLYISNSGGYNVNLYPSVLSSDGSNRESDVDETGTTVV
ncbi:hypothetical protein RvY_08730 [Ramazzottius varieornatus]|uniref:Uncharacterized protein n=1 Tax=Ramazzottius varieornatus TaxID=947166 RepID=A0A1D1VEW4_RAMVA|nr:hypothetical protein RvY_08730 [Ramazzottius varieornatus]